MGVLTNTRQERFCQLLKRGIPPYRAYPMAGYAANGGSPYRLQENARVKKRLAELHKGIAMQTKVTVASLTAELDEARALAAKVDQPAAMTQAIVAKAKLHGLLIERKEAGLPGDFANLQTEQEVLDALRAELGDAADGVIQALVAIPPPVQPAPEPVEIPERGESDRLN